MSSCRRAIPHHVHDTVSHRLIVLKLLVLSQCLCLASIVWPLSIGRRSGLSGAWNSARKHSTDGLRAAMGLPPSIAYPSRCVPCWCWAGAVRGQFPGCFALPVLPAAVSCRKSGLRRTGCVHMPAGNANIWRPSPPRFLSPLSFPSWWCHAERAPFGARMGSVFAPGW